MEMKKLHMGTMSFGFDSMDEVAHQLATAYGASVDQSRLFFATNYDIESNFYSAWSARIFTYWRSTGNTGPPGHVCSRQGHCAWSRTLS
jgi:hypothetical protein